MYRLTAVDDAVTATRRLRGDYPGQDKEAKKAGEEGYEAVRASAQQYVCPMRFHVTRGSMLTMIRPTKPGRKRRRQSRSSMPTAPMRRSSMRRPRPAPSVSYTTQASRSTLPPTSSMPSSRTRPPRRHHGSADCLAESKLEVYRISNVMIMRQRGAEACYRGSCMRIGVYRRRSSHLNTI